MKTVSLLILFSLFTTYVSAQEITFLSYNIRYNNVSDGENQWNNRKPEVASLIKAYGSDIIGVQEALWDQVQYLDKSLVDHNFIGIGRNDGKKKGEFSAIFYNSKKFKEVKEGTFWLSSSPNKISVGWDASMERICTYVQLETIDNKQKFWVFNTHFDHRGPKARLESAKLILDQIKTLNPLNLPTILMGDFNALPDSEPIKTIQTTLEDSRIVANNNASGPFSTFNGFSKKVHAGQRIDYVFVKNVTVLQQAHINEKRGNGLQVSDHLAVLCRVSLLKDSK